MPRAHTHDDAPDTTEAFRRLAASDPGPGRDALCEELVTAWLPMADRLAARYRNKGEDLEDLRQVAAIGLLKAVQRYCPDRGPFAPYAVPTITGEIRRHFRDHAWDVRVPRRVQNLRGKVRLARRELLDRPGRPGEPTVAEVSAHTGLTTEEVLEGLEAMDSYSALSLDARTGPAGEPFSLADTLGETDPRYDLVARREAAKDGLSKLSERDRHILYLRFFEDMTQSRIAERVGLSQMHVSRLITRSCAQVRACADAPPGRRVAA
ncbi:SigB/SigF/SigG family RNA polymerase sigma factor [Streptomyces sp. NPDC049813]|uniref:SigB/SigF/SigG family RNA polymerase sigma factor n=1 Tax=Streptomyces sp. NPDC049813 TaxID=3365597 RepID=UPI003788CD84